MFWERVKHLLALRQSVGVNADATQTIVRTLMFSVISTSRRYYCSDSCKIVCDINDGYLEPSACEAASKIR
eukprot:1625-Heterococcus_DN1.PRE.1